MTGLRETQDIFAGAAVGVLAGHAAEGGREQEGHEEEKAEEQVANGGAPGVAGGRLGAAAERNAHGDVSRGVGLPRALSLA
jgi:hypothetical protein